MRRRYDKIKFLCFVLVIVLGALFLFYVTGKQESRGEGARSQATVPQGDQTVAVYVDGQTPGALAAAGSGVILAAAPDALWIVTAGHVLERAGSEHAVQVEFSDGSIAECLQYELVRDADLAFLCIPKENLPEKCREYPVAETDKESYDALESGDAVCLTGYREGRLSAFSGVLSESWIYVVDFEQYMMVAECEMEYGMSGGGLYDEAGHLIGIACGGNGQGELAAVPIHVVRARFEELKR